MTRTSGTLGLRTLPHRVEARIVNPLSEREWDRWISSDSAATIFHSSAWAQVLNETYGHRPCYLRILAHGEPVALVPVMEVQTLFTKLRGICVPFSDHCAPLVAVPFLADLIVQKLKQVGRERGWNYFEVRSDSILPQAAPASECYYGHRLDLTPGSRKLHSRFASSAERAIRKARRSGLCVSIRSDADAMAQFYSLHVRTRRRHGVPPQPRRFFASIQRNIINAGMGFIVLVQSGERALAAAVFFRFGTRAVYKFGASDERSQALRPNNLMMEQAITFLADSGLSSLDFGRTEKVNAGLRRFKLLWGPKEEEIRYGKFSVLSDSWVGLQGSHSTLRNHIFRSMPISANKLAGALLYPHLD